MQKHSRIRLTDHKVASFKPPTSGQVERFDLLVPGLCIRLSYGGTKSWSVYVRINGELARIGLGRFPDVLSDGSLTMGVTVEQARDAARIIRAKARHGIDARLEASKMKSESDAARAQTFAFMVDKFLGSPAARKLRTRTIDAYRLVLKGDTSNPLKGKPVATITRKDLIPIIRGLEDEGKFGMAALTKARLSGFFAWLAADEIVAVNPVAGVKLHAPSKIEQKPLKIEEIQRVHAAAGKAAGTGSGLARFLMLCPKRRREASLMKWSDIADVDTETPTWTIPASNSKNGKPYVVPLTPALVAIIRAQPKTRSQYVFATSGTRPYSAFSPLKSRLDAIIADDGGPPMPQWSFHSFRHAFSTHCNKEALARPDVIELTLSHESWRAGVTGIYNRGDYLSEIRKLLQAWSDAVLGAETPANVIPLARVSA